MKLEGLFAIVLKLYIPLVAKIHHLQASNILKVNKYFGSVWSHLRWWWGM